MEILARLATDSDEDVRGLAVWALNDADGCNRVRLKGLLGWLKLGGAPGSELHRQVLLTLLTLFRSPGTASNGTQ